MNSNNGLGRPSPLQPQQSHTRLLVTYKWRSDVWLDPVTTACAFLAWLALVL